MYSEWKELINNLKDLPEENKIYGVQHFFTKIYYATDWDVYNVKDHWASPKEFLERGAGDCEDFAIAKFYSLKQLEIDESRLFLLYCKLIKNDEWHMVLTYKPINFIQSKYIIDNIDTEIKLLTERNDIIPVIYFNTNNSFIRKEGKRIQVNMKTWQDKLKKLEKGIDE